MNWLNFGSQDMKRMLDKVVMSVTRRHEKRAFRLRASISSSFKKSALRSRTSLVLPTSIWLTV